MIGKTSVLFILIKHLFIESLEYLYPADQTFSNLWRFGSVKSAENDAGEIFHGGLKWKFWRKGLNHYVAM